MFISGYWDILSRKILALLPPPEEEGTATADMRNRDLFPSAESTPKEGKQKRFNLPELKRSSSAAADLDPDLAPLEMLPWTSTTAGDQSSMHHPTSRPGLGSPPGTEVEGLGRKRRSTAPAAPAGMMVPGFGGRAGGGGGGALYDNQKTAAKVRNLIGKNKALPALPTDINSSFLELGSLEDGGTSSQGLGPQSVPSSSSQEKAGAGAGGFCDNVDGKLSSVKAADSTMLLERASAPLTPGACARVDEGKGDFNKRTSKGDDGREKAKATNTLLELLPATTYRPTPAKRRSSRQHLERKSKLVLPEGEGCISKVHEKGGIGAQVSPPVYVADDRNHGSLRPQKGRGDFMNELEAMSPSASPKGTPQKTDTTIGAEESVAATSNDGVQNPPPQWRALGASSNPNGGGSKRAQVQRPPPIEVPPPSKRLGVPVHPQTSEANNDRDEIKIEQPKRAPPPLPKRLSPPETTEAGTEAGSVIQSENVRNPGISGSNAKDTSTLELPPTSASGSSTSSSENKTWVDDVQFDSFNNPGIDVHDRKHMTMFEPPDVRGSLSLRSALGSALSSQQSAREDLGRNRGEDGGVERKDSAEVEGSGYYMGSSLHVDSPSAGSQIHIQSHEEEVESSQGEGSRSGDLTPRPDDDRRMSGDVESDADSARSGILSSPIAWNRLASKTESPSPGATSDVTRDNIDDVLSSCGLSEASTISSPELGTPMPETAWLQARDELDRNADDEKLMGGPNSAVASDVSTAGGTSGYDGDRSEEATGSDSEASSESSASFPGSGARMSDGLEWLWKTSRFTDVTISCGHYNFPLHQCILSAQSSYFRDSIRENLMSTRKGNVLELNDDHPVALRSVLKYLYTGTLSVPLDNLLILGGPEMPSLDILLRVYKLACKYDLPDLKQLATEQYCATLDRKWPKGHGFLLAKGLAETFSEGFEDAEDLREATLEVAMQHGEELLADKVVYDMLYGEPLRQLTLRLSRGRKVGGSFGTASSMCDKAPRPASMAGRTSISTTSSEHTTSNRSLRSTSRTSRSSRSWR